MTTEKKPATRIVLPDEIDKLETGGQQSLFYTPKRMTKGEIKAAIQRWREQQRRKGYTAKEISKLEVEFVKTMQVRDSIPSPSKTRTKRSYDDDY